MIISDRYYSDNRLPDYLPTMTQVSHLHIRIPNYLLKPYYFYNSTFYRHQTKVHRRNRKDISKFLKINMVNSSSSNLGASQRQHRCAGQLSCCCGPKACRLCCQVCPATQESTSTKFIYSIILVLASCLMGTLLITT